MKKIILTILVISIVLILLESIFDTYLDSYRFMSVWLLLFFLIIYPFALGLIFWSIFLKTKMKTKIIIFTSSITLIIFSLLFRGKIISLPDYVNFFLTKSSLIAFNNKLNSPGNIKSMNSFEWQWKFINDYNVTLSKDEIDTSNSNNQIFYWKDVLAKEGIDSAKFKEFRNILIENRLVLFSKNDKFTEFIINGYSGIIYSKLGIDELNENYFSRHPRIENPFIKEVCEDWYVF